MAILLQYLAGGNNGINRSLHEQAQKSQDTEPPGRELNPVPLEY